MSILVKIKFIKQGIEVDIPSGSEFLEIHERHPQLPLRFGCRRGECGTCTIKILSGSKNLTRLSPLEMETLGKKGCESNCRLACQCAINGPVEIE